VLQKLAIQSLGLSVVGIAGKRVIYYALSGLPLLIFSSLMIWAIRNRYGASSSSNGDASVLLHCFHSAARAGTSSAPAPPVIAAGFAPPYARHGAKRIGGQVRVAFGGAGLFVAQNLFRS